MGRKTYSFSAVALAAMAGLSFSSADSVEAFAQDGAAKETVENVTDVAGETPVEIVPDDIVYVSIPVVQPLASETGEAADAGSLGELVSTIATDSELSEQMHCLAGTVYFESRGEPLAGQLAVAQVVINRSEDRRFPASYCAVVYQRAQFSFIKNGQMPRIRTNSAAWDRAKAIAQIAHDGLWASEANDAVYFHAKYVRPKWSRVKTPVVSIDTHIFYR